MSKIRKLAHATIAVAATGTAFSANYEDLDPRIKEQGPSFIKCIEVFVPDFTNTVTTVVGVSSPRERGIYASSALNKNTTTLLSLTSVPVEYGSDITLTLSGAAGGTGGTVELDIWVEDTNT